MRTFNLFISHSWQYGNEYENLVKHLKEAPYFSWNNYSVPKNDPIHDAANDKQLYEAIKKQISPSSVVIILAGVYASYSRWIDKEIRIAKTEFFVPKPIIAIEPFGSERTSTVVKQNADRIVKMQTDKIIEAIRELA